MTGRANPDPKPPTRRIPADAREHLARELRHQYEQGASIRQLCEQHGRSYGQVHKLLADAGATFRSRGGRVHRH